MLYHDHVHDHDGSDVHNQVHHGEYLVNDGYDRGIRNRDPVHSSGEVDDDHDSGHAHDDSPLGDIQHHDGSVPQVRDPYKGDDTGFQFRHSKQHFEQARFKYHLTNWIIDCPNLAAAPEDLQP